MNHDLHQINHLLRRHDSVAALVHELARVLKRHAPFRRQRAPLRRDDVMIALLSTFFGEPVHGRVGTSVVRQVEVADLCGNQPVRRVHPTILH